MQRLEVSGAVRHIYASLGFKGLSAKLDGRNTHIYVMKVPVQFIQFPYGRTGGET